ncbi:MAG: phosphoribosyltransferase family protein [Candidatus Aenigmatarchaeota archaeon]
MFYDRAQAGEVLAEELKKLKVSKDFLILAIPKGGVLVGHSIAKMLGLKLSIVPVRKLPIPWSPEAGFGAVAIDGSLCLNKKLVRELGLKEDEIKRIVKVVLKEVKRRQRIFGSMPNIKNKNVIIVDDGLASGYTALAALKLAKRKGAKRIIIASPVASLSAYRLLRRYAKVICLYVDRSRVFAVASFYRHFPELSDEEILKCLEE